MADTADGAPPVEGETGKKNHNKYRRDKPWDHEGIDHWAVPEFKEGDMTAPLLEESSFATLFPQYREAYLREVWPMVTRSLQKHGIACELNLVEGSMTVKTTRKTWDPYAILKARDLVKLLARSVPVQQALRILEDEMNCDIIKIGGMVRNRERFIKRRQRLVGPNGATLKAIELLTGCYVLVQGNTVSAMGSFKGLKQVRAIITDCMNNVHPIYHIRTLMIKRELAKDPKLANENWDRFLPKFKKRNVKRRAPAAAVEKKEYTPFPPENHQMPSKIDLQIESGEYFLTESQRKAKRLAEKKARNAETAQQRKQERAQEFVAPKEAAGKKRKRAEGAEADSKKQERQRAKEVAAMRDRLLAQHTATESKAGASAADFLTGDAAAAVAAVAPASGTAKRRRVDALAAAAVPAEPAGPAKQGGTKQQKKKRRQQAPSEADSD